MQADLKVRNIVLVGIFNINTFDKYFFIKNNLAKEEEIQPNSVFANNQGIAQVFTSKFHFLLTLNQIIITALKPEEIADDINLITKSFVRAGNIKNITSFGINFHWYLSDPSKPLEQISKDCFYNEKIDLLSKYFANANSIYGIYASTQVGNARLKLDVKPNRTEKPNILPYDEFFNFSFNYHFDIKNKNDNIEIISLLNEYDYYYKESEKIVLIYK